MRINERIRDTRPSRLKESLCRDREGEPIADAHFAAVYDHVHRVAAGLVAEGSLPWHPSFFETMTALAFEHFARQGVQIAVAEVGMGGRLDATNVLEPLLSVITDIDLDHQKFLGNTIAEIAGEKAGIMRSGRPLITLPQHPEANATLGQAIARKRGGAGQCGALCRRGFAAGRRTDPPQAWAHRFRHGRYGRSRSKS